MKTRLTALPVERFVGTRELIAARIVSDVTAAAQAAIRDRGVFTLAIAGGSVADVCLPLLANAALAWEHVHIFWCDERAVPLSDAESNAGKALQLVAGSLLAERATMHIMPVGETSLERSAEVYAAELEAVAGRPARLDVVLVGVGEDGHVASLFPAHPALREKSRSVIAITGAPKPPPSRLSLTLPVLTGARRVVVAAFGAGKAQAMQQALENSASVLPVALVVQQSTHVAVMLDAAAASLLQNKKDEAATHSSTSPR